jgi:hypothetical protein
MALLMTERMRADLLRMEEEELSFAESTDRRRFDAISRVPAGTNIDVPIPDGQGDKDDELEGLSDEQIAGMVKDYHYGNYEPPEWFES